MLQVGWAPSRVLSVLSRLLIGLVGAVGAAIVGVPGIAAAEPPPDPVPQPPPPPLNVNAFAPVKLSEYAVMDNNWYAFSTPGGDTCVLQKTGSYGCSGALPGAPDGANLVSGGVDRALEFRVRLRGLRRNRDIGAVARGAQRDGEPDAAAGAGYEQRFAFEGCHGGLQSSQWMRGRTILRR